MKDTVGLLQSKMATTTIQPSFFVILLSFILSSRLLVASTIQSQANMSLFVTHFGATGNGRRYDTAAIQATIDACATSQRMCQVIFPAPGRYLTATVYLRSGVFLHVEPGATILGGTKLEDYPKESERWYVVLAENATEVGVTGGGEVNGQGLQFIVNKNERKNVMVSWNQTGTCLGDECRPRLLGFLGCNKVRISNITLKDPAYWCLHLVRCQNSEIHDVSIYGDFNTPNNDGIDIEDSNHTVISRCHIDTGDDAICPKTTTSPVYNLTVSDCWIRTKSSAIKLGSASWFDFKHLVFDNITVVDSHRGLAMQIRDGGNVSDVAFSNINIITRYYDPSWWGGAEPIYVTTCPRHSNSTEGSISNVLFTNINATSENGVFLSGSKRGLLRNLRFINVNLTYKRWTHYAGGFLDYRPDCQGIVKHDTAGIMMENIQGLEIKDVDMRWSKGVSRNWNNPMEFRPDTVNNVSFLNFHTGSSRGVKIE